MKKHMVRTLAAGIAIALTAGSADAAMTFNVNGTFSTAVSGGAAAGTLTGSFTTTDDRSAITSYNLVASAAGAFIGFTYAPGTSSVTAATLPSQYFQIDSLGNVNELRVYFTSGLTASGGTINNAFSYENEPSGGNRFLSGNVTAASAAGPSALPEPATWGMLILGMGIAGFGLRRKVRESEAKFDAEIKAITAGA